MTDLGEIVMQFAGDRDPVRRAALELAVQAFEGIRPTVVAFEEASKGLPRIRKSAQRREPSVLTRGGRPQIGEDSTLLISVAQLADVLSSIAASFQTDAAVRKPADAILGAMAAIEGDGRSIDAGLGAHEETAGGHVRF